MKLQHITFTGIDGKTDLGALWELQQQYPITEFGVLVAKNWRDNGNRYFNPTFLDTLRDRGLKLSCHLCGSIARAAVRGDWEPFRLWARGNWDIFQRCQINIATSQENPVWFVPTEDRTMFDEVILQQRGSDDCPLFMNTYRQGADEHVTTLLDASGGEGINTPIVPLNLVHKIGYAGGMNEDNVADKLRFLLESDRVHDFWIDMESGVRTDDWFDVDKVRRVLKICEPIINKYK